MLVGVGVSIMCVSVVSSPFGVITGTMTFMCTAAIANWRHSPSQLVPFCIQLSLLLSNLTLPRALLGSSSPCLSHLLTSRNLSLCQISAIPECVHTYVCMFVCMIIWQQTPVDACKLVPSNYMVAAAPRLNFPSAHNNAPYFSQAE